MLIDWPISGVSAVGGGWLDPNDHSCPSVVPSVIHPDQFKLACTHVCTNSKTREMKTPCSHLWQISAVMSPSDCQQSPHNEHSEQSLNFQISCLLNPLSTDVLQPNHSKWYYHNSFSPSRLLIEYMTIYISEEERKLVPIWENKGKICSNQRTATTFSLLHNWCGKVTWHQICALWVTGQHWVFAGGQRPRGAGLWDERLPRKELPLCINGG